MKNKTLKIILIIILSILTIVLTSLYVYLLKNNKSINIFHIKNTFYNEITLEEKYNNIYDEINIESKSSDIEIKESSDNNINVIVYGKKENTSIKTDNNKLMIKNNEKSCIGICINTKISKIEIYIPNNYNKKITIDNKYGDISIGDFKESIFIINDDSGDIEIKNAKKAKIVNKYGDVEVKGKVDILEINDDSGDIKINNVNDIKVINKYGDIEINNINNYIEAKNDCGDINIKELTINKNSNIKTNYGDIEIDKTNEIYIDAKTTLGSVKVNNNYPKSNTILTIKNDCGDVTIDN